MSHPIPGHSYAEDGLRFIYYSNGVAFYKLELPTGNIEVSEDTVINAGFSLPRTPDYRTWLKYVSTKQRCPKCWRSTRNQDDLNRHYETNGCKPKEEVPHESEKVSAS